MKLLTTHPGLTPLLTLALPSAALMLAVTLWSSREAPAPLAAQAPHEGAAESYGRVPLGFEANRGQTDASVNFLARGAGYALFLTPAEAVLVLQDGGRAAGRSPGTGAPTPTAAPQPKVLRMKVVGAAASAAAEGLEELAGRANYLVGNNPSKWRTDVPTYGRVRYAGVYPGVDLVYYGNQRQMEYDFHIAPGADARAVSLEFDGADGVEVDAGGDLLLKLGESVVRQPKPFAYQEVAGARREVDAGYEVGADGRVRFAVGGYDRSAPLVIDPTLVYSSYLGGTSLGVFGDGTDQAHGIAVDSSGSAYVCGVTTSANFPTANALQGTRNSRTEAFITKLTPAGTAIVYSTYLGGGDVDRCFDIAVDSVGNAYVAGETQSTDFPTANAFQASFGGAPVDGFVTKLNASGSALVYSTYLGGGNHDAVGGVALDSSNNVYVTGHTASDNFPTAGAIQATLAGAGPGNFDRDAFVTKLNAAGTALVYSTYLGGDQFDFGESIAVDAAGAAYVTGRTSSANFPTANALQGANSGSDAFVTKLNPAGSAFSYSTFLGGSGGEDVGEIAVDSAGNAYVVGTTFSTDFPTANAFQNTRNGGSDAFVTKLNPAGSAFVFSTYFGGGDSELGNAIMVDASGNVHIAGDTSSTNLPTVNPVQAANAGRFDAFVTTFNSAGTAVLFSTYLGGGTFDGANALALDAAKNVYLAGDTESTDFPTAAPFQAANADGNSDAFITKIGEICAGPGPLFQFTHTMSAVQEDVTVLTLTVQRAGDTSGAATVDYATSDGTASGRRDYTTALGTLRFAAGETAKNIDLLVNEDSFSEGDETFTVALSNPTGGALLSCTAAVATIRITDDAVEPTANAIDDAAVFVGTHYHDFLNRQADPPGLAHWTNVINNCGDPDPLVCRINVSAAFFLSIEFQQTGYLVERIYKASYGDATGTSTLGGTPHTLTVPVVRFEEFLADTQEIGRGVVVLAPGWEGKLEANKTAFTQEFVQRPRFTAAFPATMTPTAFVDQLNARAGHPLDATERQNLIDELTSNNTTSGRASVLRKVAEDATLDAAEKNRAFVLMQYFGYLRRNPNDLPDSDHTGYDFWLGNLEKFGGNFEQAELVKAFISSAEYRQRFGQ